MVSPRAELPGHVQRHCNSVIPFVSVVAYGAFASANPPHDGEK